MMGYVILQYHDRLGYPVELETLLASIYPAGFPASQPSGDAAGNQQHKDLLNEISMLVQKGNLEEAIFRIEEQVPLEDVDDLELSKRYMGLLKICKKQEKLLAHAPLHLKLLALAGLKSKAIELYMECLRLDKSFTLKPLILYKIAVWLDESNSHREAILAFNSL
jgi:tetratricopeptide (TPR) repeat protein